MIRDIVEFRRTGVAGRRVAELDMPVDVWRAEMSRVARRDGVRVRTFVVPSTATGPDGRPESRTVFAVRTDPPPEQVSAQGRHVRWWRIEELGMPFRRWRAVLHGAARRERARIRTFLSCTNRDASDRLVYVIWTEDEPVVPAPADSPSSVRAAGPVTDLTRYAAARHPSAGLRRRVLGTES